MKVCALIAMTKKFYEINKDKARDLVAKQIIDCWSYEDIRNYWYSLGYDIFFINSVIKPYFVNPKD